MRWMARILGFVLVTAASLAPLAAQDSQSKHWAFQPVAHVEPPQVDHPDWAQNPIDQFIYAELKARGLQPAGLADKRTLIRRATFDLIGLPPTPEEVQAFLEDESPEAFARVVERLLASRHYGERWGRHWLDLARYSDTAGDSSDYPIPQAYLYRNYVIDAFNRDMPYDQFLREQIAGDKLAQLEPDDRYAEKIIATGFIALSRRFGGVTKGQPHLIIEDTIDTLGRATMAMTLRCARCHDHMTDPITTRDYYALYGIFESTRYPHPGAEHGKEPFDFVPLVPPDQMPADEAEAKKVPLAYAVIDAEPRDARIHLRGEPHQKGQRVKRGVPAVLRGAEPIDITNGSGRLELANWLTRPDHPLTSRVMVNRIWQYHFGKGIVKSSSNFGVNGDKPTHPQLLDYLARRFVEEGWSIKAMHRLIMLSRTYQLASNDRQAWSANHGIDGDNNYYWKFDRRRLDAESLRDAMLAVSGTLDPEPGGPHPFPPQEKWNYTQHKQFSDDYPTNKRSVYQLVRRLRKDTFSELFDGPDPNASTECRRVSTVPMQALFLMNSPWVAAQSQAFAKRMLMAEPDDAARVRLAMQLAWTHDPTNEEIADSLNYLAEYRKALQKAGEDNVDQKAWTSFCRVLLASNAFVYVD